MKEFDESPGPKRQASQNSNAEAIAAVELTSDHVGYFREAGASEVLLTVMEVDPEDAGLDHNPVRQEARRMVFDGDLDGTPEMFTPDGGRYFNKLWDGELYNAYRYHTPGTKTELIEAVFGEDQINANRPDSDAPKVSELSPIRFMFPPEPIHPWLENE
ncbi:hypothetical protein [Natronomonas sp.]|uniref:hypothetical protein n=1 Tax=Natronomonas sp. TaxID=2184060 RepID=UPI003975BEA7